MTENWVANRLKVNGVVQGVGFRPFIFQLAEQYDLKGEVANTSSGVTIQIEGLAEQVAAFERDLSLKSPPLAYIVEISSQPNTFRNFAGFSIAKSNGEAKTSTLISPDVSVGDDCLGELLNPDDRRYHYPFINCTNCGPRYTIIDDIPYDRPKTSMRHFKMCAACQSEYDDPHNRRFHAQPNACADCGPHVNLYDHRRNPMSQEDSIGKATELLKQGFVALVMTSGNLSDEPIAIDNDDAFERLSCIADYFLIHNREIYLRSDDSIVRHHAGARRFLRRSRGFVPIPIFLKNQIPPILACGAELKNTICVTKQDKAFLSQHIGDLENLATYEFLKLTASHLKRILGIDPEIIAFDLHPDYLSTRFALEQPAAHKIQVQHHHAHIVSCMAEHKLEGPVIGLSFDGTGYGRDGAIWGGEILIAEEHDFERAGHLAYVAMPGGAAAIKAPWRMAVSYLQDAFGQDFYELGLPVLKEIENHKLTIISEMISKGVNAPLTSSLGRLFDGVAAICRIRSQVNFEGQAAMELEMLAADTAGSTYEYEWLSEDTYKILPAPIILGVVKDLQDGKPVADISAKFHRTLICLFADLCTVIRKERDLNRIVLSGGVFQNSTLLAGLFIALEARNFSVFSHQQVPTNDGGISLGQAVAAAAVSRR